LADTATAFNFSFFFLLPHWKWLTTYYFCFSRGNKLASPRPSVLASGIGPSPDFSPGRRRVNSCSNFATGRSGFVPFPPSFIRRLLPSPSQTGPLRRVHFLVGKMSSALYPGPFQFFSGPPTPFPGTNSPLFLSRSQMRRVLSPHYSLGEFFLIYPPAFDGCKRKTRIQHKPRWRWQESSHSIGIFLVASGLTHAHSQYSHQFQRRTGTVLRSIGVFPRPFFFF